MNGIATMCKNQGTRLKEWIEYHSNRLNIKKFIIFLDDCSDESEKILNSIVDIDISIYKTNEFGIETQRLHWIERSHKVYDFVLDKYNYLDWICFIEVDEFIFCQNQKIKFDSFLQNLNSECLYINSWDFKGPFDENKNILGQSNLIWTDEQRYYSEYRYRGKSIIRPSYFSKCIDAHHFLKKNNTVSNQFKKNRNNVLQVFYGDEVTIDDDKFRIYHFRNHTPSSMNKYKNINYL